MLNIHIQHVTSGLLFVTSVSYLVFLQIVFYEDKNFQGHSFECSSDCPELNTHFSRCNSVRVESGAWVLYERPNYLGYQYILTKGDYPDYQRWMGYNETVRSCRIIRNVSQIFFCITFFKKKNLVFISGIFSQFVCTLTDRRSHELAQLFVLQMSSVFRIRVHERPDFSGQMLECTEDLRDLADHWHRHEVHSAQVLDGAWVFFELPNFQGRQYLLEKGEYRRFTEWAAMNPKVGSFRRVV